MFSTGAGRPGTFQGMLACLGVRGIIGVGVRLLVVGRKGRAGREPSRECWPFGGGLLLGGLVTLLKGGRGWGWDGN